MRTVLITCLVLTAGLAGCLADQAPSQGLEEQSTPPVRADLVQSHDHGDISLHGQDRGLEQVGYHNLAPGTDGSQATDRGPWMNTEIALHEGRAFVGYTGAPWLLSVVDVTDPTRPELLGSADGGSAWAMDIDASEDGQWAFVSVYNGPVVGSLFARDYVVENPQAPTGPGAPGVAVVDARDPSSPQVTGFLPIHGLGPHTAVHHTFPDGRGFVFANKAEGGVPGNAIVIAEVVAAPGGGRTLAPVSEFHLDLTDGGTFPHDVDVREHPITGQMLLYAAWWDAGLVIVDVTDPAQPEMVAHFEGYPADQEVQLHDVHPYPEAIDGKHYTVSSPEIPGGDTTGHVRIYDTTDPASPELVGSWTLPSDVVVDEPFLFSTHNFAFLPDGRIALAHGHAGVWILDWLGPGGVTDPDPAQIEKPVATAYHVPSEPGAPVPEWNPVSGAPWVWGTQIDADGRIWALDAATGLHGLELADG